MKQSFPLSRRSFLNALGGLTLGALVPQTTSAQTTAKRKNVVVFLIDDLGWTDVGCYGSTFYETPNVDRLATMGMRFTDGYAACTVCSPTRASMMTGKYPARLHCTDWISGHKRPYAKLRVPDWTMLLSPRETTIAEALKPAGYVNGFIGKWHLGPTAEYWPLAQGFDTNVGGYSRGSPPSYFAPYKIPTMQDGEKGEYLTDRHAKDAEAFLEKNAGNHFFLYLSMYAVHTPLQAKQKIIDKYAAKAKADPAKAQGNPIYAAMLESMDDCVGRVLAKLETLKLLEDTIIVFTGDNGGLIGNPKRPVTSNLPLRAGKGSAYEGGVREPFIVYCPGLTQPGSTCSVPVMTIDIYPTLLDLLGIEGDSSHNAEMDGRSLVPLLRGTSTWQRDSLYWHYPHYHPGGATPYGAIREGDFKLIEFFEDQRLELYNLKKDIGEKNNLASSAPQIAQRLAAKLEAWRQRVGAQMPSENPDYDPELERQPRTVNRKNIKHPAFAILRGGSISKVAMGWRLKTPKEATALKELETPVTTRARFRLQLQTKLKREDGWQNGFLALAPEAKDGKQIAAGIYIGGLRLSIFEGLSTAKIRETTIPASFDRQQCFQLTVDVDLPKRTLSLTTAGKTLVHPLPKWFHSIRYIGYHAMQTTCEFSEITQETISGK